MELDIEKRAGYCSDILRPYLLCLVLFLGVCLILPNGMNLRVQRVVNLEILVLLVLAVQVFKVNKWLGLLLGYVAVTIPFHQAIDSEVMFAIMSYSVLYLWIAGRRWNTEWLWNTICVLAILCVVWQVFQVYGVWILQAPFSGIGPKIGFLSNQNETSAFLAICLPCFFRKYWKWLLPIPLVGLYMGVSYGGIVAAAIVGILYLVIHREDIGVKKVLAVGVVLAILMGVYTWNKLSGEHNFGSRAKYWTETLPVVSMKPLGWGLGQYKYVMPLVFHPTLMNPQTKMVLYQNVGDKVGLEKALQKVSGGDAKYLLTQRWNEIWIEAHNEYLEVWMTLGIIGLLLMLAVIFRSLWEKDSIPKYGFMIACISAIWFFSFQIVPIALISTVYLGVLNEV